MPQRDEPKTFMVEDAQLIFRNFEGKEGPYNLKGDRNFAVILPSDVADQMLKDGWSVKYLRVTEEGEEPTPYVSINVNFKNRPPRIVMMTSRVRTHLNQETVDTLDWADISKADLICNGYDWDINGKQGTKAYLKSLFVTLEEDYLEQKYAVNDVGGE